MTTGPIPPGTGSFRPTMAIPNYKVTIRTRAGITIELTMPPITLEELFERIKSLDLYDMHVQEGIPVGLAPGGLGSPESRPAPEPAPIPAAVPVQEPAVTSMPLVPAATATPAITENKPPAPENDLFFLNRKKRTTQGHKSRVVSWA